MKETEIRIGNKVLFDDEVYGVAGISQGFSDEPFDVNLKDSDGMFMDAPIEDTEGITLSEEWLKRFGFEKNLNSYTYSSEYVSMKIYHDIAGDQFLYNRTSFKFVHQLQNLFFSLVGIELTLTGE